MLKYHIFRKLNFVLAILGLIFTVIYYRYYGNFISPILFTLLLITLSTVYSYKYRRVVTRALKSLGNIPLPREKVKADIYVEQIRDTIRSIRAAAKERRELLLVTSFFENIDDIEDAVKKLYENYKKCRKFLDSKRNMVTEKEMEEIRQKIKYATGNRKKLLQGIYDNKQKTIDEIENIRGSLKESLLNLQYILSNLQQIETTINSVSVSSDAGSEYVRKASDSLSIFEELKGSLRKMRL